MTIQDFGVYAGRQTIELAPDCHTKPIILIGGLNGGGKTTFLDSLQLCLYGNQAKISNRGSLSYDDYLANCIHKGNGATSASIEIEFQQRRNGIEHNYKVLRSWAINNQKCKEHFVVVKNGELDQVAINNWGEHVDRFLPKQIAPLFFFDGEKVEEYADPAKTPDLISTAIHGLLGLDTITSLLSDLTILEKRKRLSKMQIEEIEKLQEFEKELIHKQSSLDAMRQKQAHIKTVELVKISRKLDVVMSELHNKGGHLYEQRSKLENSLHESIERKNLMEACLRDHASGVLPLLLIEPLIDKLKIEIDQCNKVRTAKLEKEIITKQNYDFLEFLSDNSNDSKLLSKTQQYLTTQISKLDEILKHSARLIPSNQTESSIKTIKFHFQEELANETKKLNQELEEVLEKIEIVTAEIDRIPSLETIKELVQEKESLEKSKASLLDEIESQSLEIKRRASELERLQLSLKKQYEGAAINAQGQEDDKRVIEYITKSQKSLKQYKKNVIHKHIKQIQNLVLDRFSYLSRKGSLISKIEICPDTFEISLYDKKKGKYGSERLSAGERQILSIAILWGLANASNRPLPTIIDTPLGRLDSIHRDNLVDNYFPQASHQIILLSTDKEIGENERRRIKNSISKEYTLDFDESKGQTKIVEGYFPKESYNHVH